MGNAKDRIGKIEKSMSAKQAAIATILELHRFKSPEEVLRWRGNHPEERGHLAQLMLQVASGVRSRMKGQPPKQIQKVMHDSLREAQFLYLLHAEVNQHVETEGPTLVAMSLLLLNQTEAAVKKAFNTPVSLVYLDNGWHDELRYHMFQVFTLRAVAEQVSQQHFDGIPILWDVYAEQIN